MKIAHWAFLLSSCSSELDVGASNKAVQSGTGFLSLVIVGRLKWRWTLQRTSTTSLSLLILKSSLPCTTPPFKLTSPLWRQLIRGGRRTHPHLDFPGCSLPSPRMILHQSLNTRRYKRTSLLHYHLSMAKIFRESKLSREHGRYDYSDYILC